MSKSKKKKVKRPVVRPVVFTGPRSALSSQREYVKYVLQALKLNVSITGSAPGIDQMVYYEVVKLFPKARHIVVVPWKYPEQRTFWSDVEKNGHELLFMPKPTRTDRHPFLIRNEWMLDKAIELNPEKARLVGFPGSAVEQLRSGTWACIRDARKRSMRIDLFPLADALGSSDQGLFEGIYIDPTAHFEHGVIVRDEDELARIMRDHMRDRTWREGK